jgi:hypothetical protein
MAQEDEAHRRATIQWIEDGGSWTHAVTITMSRTKYGVAPGNLEVLRRCRLYLSSINQRLFNHGRHRHGYRIGSMAFLGYGVNEDNPHVHWVIAAPPDENKEKFAVFLRDTAASTAGIGAQVDVQSYYGVGWIRYMCGHGFGGFIHQVSFPAKWPSR